MVTVLKPAATAIAPFMSVLLTEARRTLALAGPIIVGQVSQMLMGVTDSIMIGLVGKVPLAAAAFATTIFNVVFVIGIGLLIPVAVLVSRARGAGRDAEGAEWLRHGLALALFYCAAGGLIMLALGSQLHRFGQPEEVVAQVPPYYTLISISLLPVLIYQVLRQFAESMGRAVVPMVVMLASVALNVLLNWILIYGHWGAPALGLTGAGWATLASRLVSVGALVAWLYQSPSFRANWRAAKGTGPRRWGGLRRGRFHEMLHLGVPAAGSLLFEAGAFSAAALMMGWLGATALAAHQIALSCAAFTFMFPLGLSMAVSMRLARAVGEERRDSLRPIAQGAHVLSAGLMLGFASVFALGGRQLASGFVQEPEVIALAARLLVVAAIFQLFDGAQVIGAATLRALADVKIPTLITGFAYWIVALPVGYFFGVHGIGPIGIWASLAAGLAVAAVCLVWRFHRITAQWVTPAVS